MHTYFLSSRGPNGLAAEEFVVADSFGRALEDHVDHVAKREGETVDSKIFVDNLKAQGFSPRGITAWGDEGRWHFIVIEVD